MKRLLCPIALLLAAALARADSELLIEARQALAEAIPRVAVQKLERLRAQPNLAPDERTASTLLLGEALRASGEHERALQAVQPLAATGGPSARLLEAEIFASAGRWAEAQPIFEALASQTPLLPAAVLGLAESWRALGKTDRAITVLEKFTRNNRGAVAAHLRLAGLLAETGEANRARSVLALVRPEAPGDQLWKRYLEGRLLLLERKLNEALAVFEELTQPASARPQEHLSENLLLAATLGMTDARISLSGNEIADRVLEGFIWKYPNSGYLELAFQRLDQIYAAEKNPPEGELQKWAAAPQKRRAALARYYVARLQMRGRKFDRAEVSIDAFQGNFPDHPLLSAIHLMEADVQTERRQPDKVLTALEAAERHTTNEEARGAIELRAGLVYFQQGENLLAATKFESAARRSPKLRETALYNAALATLNLRNYERFFDFYRELGARFPESELRAQLILEEGLLQARSGDPRASETLRSFLQNFPKHPRLQEGRLALAEIAFSAGDQAGAAQYFQAANDGVRAPEVEEHSLYLALFLEEAKTPRDEARITDLGRQFVLKYPYSILLPEVRLKLGQVYFRNDDYANAETQLATLARESADSPYAETALFLAGQSAMRTINPGAIDRALDLFDQVVKREGTLKLYARQQQAIVQSRLGNEEEALKIYNIILAAEPPVEPELRYASLAAKGDNLVILGRKDPQRLETAIRVFEELAAEPQAAPAWRNQALYKRAHSLAQLGRAAEAMAAYYDVLGRSRAEEREYVWFYKAGFEAARSFESTKEWKSAIGIYEKMAALGGPRTAEARDRVKKLRLENFVWN